MKFKIFFLILLMSSLLSGCFNNVYTEGNYLLPSKLKELQIGQTKEEIQLLLGPYSIKANFNQNKWYYFYEKNDRPFRFINKRTIESKLLALQFDNNNQLQEFYILTEKNRKNIPYDPQTTSHNIKRKKYNLKYNKKVDALINE